jgi:hypothetical protein
LEPGGTYLVGENEDSTQKHIQARHDKPLVLMRQQGEEEVRIASMRTKKNICCAGLRAFDGNVCIQKSEGKGNEDQSYTPTMSNLRQFIDDLCTLFSIAFQNGLNQRRWLLEDRERDKTVSDKDNHNHKQKCRLSQKSNSQ